MKTPEQKAKHTAYMREYNKQPGAKAKKNQRDNQHYHNLTTEQKKERQEKARDRTNKWNYANRYKTKSYMKKYCHDYYITHNQIFKDKSKKRYLENKETITQKKVILHQLIKKVTLEYYSSGKMECAICKFNNIDALSIDHINNGGRKHLRENHITSFYRWLLKNGFPEGYQVLCMNCQTKKSKEYMRSKIKTIGTPRQLKRLQDNRQNTQEKKIVVFSHYSQGIIKCNACGEKDIEVLSIDHINGGGLAHRRIIGNRLAAWLYRNNYPEGYQVLCMNCQFIKEAEKRREKKGIGTIPILSNNLVHNCG